MLGKVIRWAVTHISENDALEGNFRSGR